MKAFLPITVVSVVVVVLLQATSFAQQPGWLSYFPAVSRLQGRLITVTKYGKPTYGTEPDKDEKVEVPILVLQTPIRVRPSPQSSSSAESMTNVSFVQLIFPDDSETTVKRHLDQTIIVAGNLSVGNRGGQFTEVVMTVRVVNPTGKPL
jgi:hypothetical protein